VLEESEEPMRSIEVQNEVERLPGSPVAPSSVKNALVRGSHGHRRLFERVERERYRFGES
jgi:hypothetical protein